MMKSNEDKSPVTFVAKSLVVVALEAIDPPILGNVAVKHGR
jgi:hypothetical protein